jgi:hypothetical protein
MAAHAITLEKLWISLRPTALTELLFSRTRCHRMIKDMVGLIVTSSTPLSPIIDGGRRRNITRSTMALLTVHRRMHTSNNMVMTLLTWPTKTRWWVFGIRRNTTTNEQQRC